MIDAVGVVVPAHDEAETLSRCLDAVDRAIAAVPPEIRRVAVVVLDACRDTSATIASRWADARAPFERRCVEVSHRNVGRARGAGMDHVLTRFSGVELERIWLTTTDADTLVPETWLTEQLLVATRGAHAIAGTVRVADWSGYAPNLPGRFEAFYESHHTEAGHAHVHGANLGVRADAYVGVGGFAPLVTGEDHALWRALEGHERVASRALSVTTSARRVARAPQGFSAFLSELERR